MLVETEKKLEGETSYYAGSEAELAKMHCDFRSEIEYFQEEESRVRKTTRTEIETAIRRELRKRTENPNEIPWLVATGAESASKKVLNVINLLESALHGDDNTLVKTMRVARNAILHIQEGVQYREGACMMQCSCTENLRIQFDPDVLSAAIVNSHAVPLGTTVLSVDIAYSLTSKADRTAIAVVRIHENLDKQKCMTVLDVEADQMRGSELCEKLARMCRQYNPSVVLIEKGPTADHLRALIDATAAKFEVSIPARFVQTSNVKNIKFQKLKDLELLISQKRCRFKSGEYVNALFEELQRIDGTRSSSRRDDRGDAISQVASVFKIYSTESSKEQTADDANEVEKIERKAALQAEMQRYFGGTNYTPPKPVEPPPTQQPAAPRVFPRGGNFATLPSGFRGWPTKR